jgi:hypothetical protein
MIGEGSAVIGGVVHGKTNAMFNVQEVKNLLGSARSFPVAQDRAKSFRHWFSFNLQKSVKKEKRKKKSRKKFNKKKN